MGRWATYVVGQEREDPPAAYIRYGGTAPGWAWWELPLAKGEPWDPGPGAAIVAYIVDSDVADIRGLTSGEPAWRWVFGEAVLAGYEGRAVDDLEDTLPRRAEEASGSIAEWAVAAGLPPVDRAALTEILQRGHVFAEAGVGELLRALGITTDDSTAETRDLEPTVDADGEPFREVSEEPAPAAPVGPRMKGVLAAAIDHTSSGWRGLVAQHWLQTFGEPPSLVSLDGSVFLAFDPPVMLTSVGPDGERDWVSTYLGVSGDWVDVPPEYAGSLTAAANWARTHVGTQGRAADEDRLPLNLEVPRDYPDGVRAPGRYLDVTENEWWQHSIARPLEAGFEVAMGDAVLDRADDIADWLDHARSLLATPLAEKYAEAGGAVHSGENDVPPYGLVMTTVWKTARGRYGSTGGDEKAWRRVQRRLRAGELTSVDLKAQVANGYGGLRDGPWGGLAIGAQLAADRRLYSLPAHLTVRISEPFRALVNTPFVGDLIGRAVEVLPVVGGWADAARILLMGDGKSRYEEFASVPADVRRDPRVCVRGPAWRILLGAGHLELLGGRSELERSGVFTDFQEVGSLLMVQCGEQPVDCTTERRARMVEVLAPVLPPWPG